MKGGIDIAQVEFLQSAQLSIYLSVLSYLLS